MICVYIYTCVCMFFLRTTCVCMCVCVLGMCISMTKFCHLLWMACHCAKWNTCLLRVNSRIVCSFLSLSELVLSTLWLQIYMTVMLTLFIDLESGTPYILKSCLVNHSIHDIKACISLVFKLKHHSWPTCAMCQWPISP